MDNGLLTYSAYTTSNGNGFSSSDKVLSLEGPSLSVSLLIDSDLRSLGAGGGGGGGGRSLSDLSLISSSFLSSTFLFSSSFLSSTP